MEWTQKVTEGMRDGPSWIPSVVKVKQDKLSVHRVHTAQVIRHTAFSQRAVQLRDMIVLYTVMSHLVRGIELLLICTRRAVHAIQGILHSACKERGRETSGTP